MLKEEPESTVGKAFQAGGRLQTEWIKQSIAQCSKSRVSLKNTSVGQMRTRTCYRLLTFSAQHLGLCILLWLLHWLAQQFGKVGKVIWVIYLLFCFYRITQSLCWECTKEPSMKIERSVKSLFDDNLLIFLVRKYLSVISLLSGVLIFSSIQNMEN